MANKTINTILNLKDNMSKGLVNVSKKVEGLGGDAKRASKQVANMTNDFKKNVDEMSTKALKLGAVGAALAGGLAIKTGLSEAMDLEGYRTQLETATKDTKKAGEIMKYAIDLANKTPYEGGELVEAAAKFEAMGLSATKYLPLVGDMAAATNKNVDQAVEAMIDAQTGELERLKEFGITKRMIAARAEADYGKDQVMNKRGQIVNQEKFNATLEKIMTEKFTGGMDKQSKTMKGIWSTVTGITKSSLAEMVGMTADGTIRTGSLMDKMKQKVQQVADKFTQWQKDGTLAKLSAKFTEVFTIIYNTVSRFVNFIIEHQEVIGFIAALFAGMLIGIKVAQGLAIAMKVLQIAWALFNGTLALSPLGWVVIGITAVVAAGYLLIKNWTLVKNTAGAMWSNIKRSFAQGANSLFESINKIIEKVNQIPGVNIPLIAKVDVASFTNRDMSDLALTPTGPNINGSHAKGLKRVPFDGYIAELHKGEAVIPAKQNPYTTSKKSSSNQTVVNVIVQGNVIGNKQFVNEVGTEIATKVKLALVNM